MMEVQCTKCFVCSAYSYLVVYHSYCSYQLDLKSVTWQVGHHFSLLKLLAWSIAALQLCCTRSTPLTKYRTLFLSGAKFMLPYSSLDVCFSII